MEVIYFDELDSTHNYVINQINDKQIINEIAVVAKKQTNGIGSRGSEWQGHNGNLFVTFVKKRNNLPNDLPLSSCSIYFAMLLKLLLAQNGSKAWLKWPNDLYIEEKKIGGLITLVKGELFIASYGLNTSVAPDGFAKLDVRIENEKIVTGYLEMVGQMISWKKVFSKFQIEFELSKKYFANINNKKISLENAILNDDGSLFLDNERIYALR